MRELSLIGVTNTKLKKSINNIQKAMNSASNSAWAIAKEFNRIIREESFKDDFGSLANLSKHLGYSKSTISAYNNVYDMLIVAGTYAQENGLPPIDKLISVGQGLEILKGVDYGEQTCEDVYKLVVELSDMTAKEIRQRLLSIGKDEQQETTDDLDEQQETTDDLDGLNEIPCNFYRDKSYGKSKWNKFIKAIKNVCDSYDVKFEEL